LSSREFFYGISIQAASSKWKSKEKKSKINHKLLTPSLKGASQEGENEREGRWWRWRWRWSLTAPVPDECFDESRPNRGSSRFGACHFNLASFPSQKALAKSTILA
jgi:hypothetical protein